MRNFGFTVLIYCFIKIAKEIEVEFHDAVEDLDELDSDEREDSPTHTVTDPKITSLRNKMASVNRRRAQIRNKRVRLFISFTLT